MKTQTTLAVLGIVTAAFVLPALLESTTGADLGWTREASAVGSRCLYEEHEVRQENENGTYYEYSCTVGNPFYHY